MGKVSMISASDKALADLKLVTRMTISATKLKLKQGSLAFPLILVYRLTNDQELLFSK